MNAYILAIYGLILFFVFKNTGHFSAFSTRYAFAEYCFVGLVFYLPIQWPKPLWIYYHCISSNISELKIFGTIHSRTRRKTGQGGLDCGYDV
jgi:hypothetical protein